MRLGRASRGAPPVGSRAGASAAAGALSAGTGTRSRHGWSRTRTPEPPMQPVPPVPDALPTPNAAAGESDFDWYVGIDCGGATHRVCVLDAAGRQVAERAVAHSGAALAAFGAWLRELAGPSLARVAVGLETPHGGPVALCLEAGAAVFAVNPKQLERFRERRSAAGAKDDRRDAYVAAAALRTDRAAFHRVQLDDAGSEER